MTLSEWLDRIQLLHPKDVELGLGRVSTVWQALGCPRLARQVIIVGGTNGKGSTVAFIDTLARAHGWSVGRYTSPHVHRFNERIAVDAADVADEMLIAAFERIETARGPVPLTFFEYTTLAGFLVFADSALDLAVLEVGLGGRLDAVNLIDADVAVVTTIALDHQDWLGPDRERIGHEKAGVFRAHAAAVIGELDPPQSVLAHAESIGSRTVRRGLDFDVVRAGANWSGRWPGVTLDELPRPGMAADIQIDNAATAIAALLALPESPAFDRSRLDAALLAARAPARLEHRVLHGKSVWFDVGHNPQAAESLARWLKSTPITGQTFAVFSLLADKDLPGVVRPLSAAVDRWFVCGLNDASPRGREATTLTVELEALMPQAAVVPCASANLALAQALEASESEDRILVFGSFHLIDHLLPEETIGQPEACPASSSTTSVVPSTNASTSADSTSQKEPVG